MNRRKIAFGVIGCGLMGREFASASAEIIAVCDMNPEAMSWFTDNFPSITLAVQDYRDLLKMDAIEAIYCAVPHNLHQRVYVDVINSGKHLLAEKPFGIDLAANALINDACKAKPNVLVRCSSEFPFYPGAQRLIQLVQNEDLGEIIEVRAGFMHSSDLDPNKPINWKRRIAVNGEYGCMGDLGLHVVHVPVRLGWKPINVRALLSNIVRERPGRDGKSEPCETWDNAILACEATNGIQSFPMILETKRIAPGETNTWCIGVSGTKLSAEFSTKNPKAFRTMRYKPGGQQAWQKEDLGSKSAYPTITGGIFEFGFSDSILQMWAAFCDEIVNRGAMNQPFYCATPAEAHVSHLLFTAALESQRTGTVAPVLHP
jgi:predicted dehydrogenase